MRIRASSLAPSGVGKREGASFGGLSSGMGEREGAASGGLSAAPPRTLLRPSCFAALEAPFLPSAVLLVPSLCPGFSRLLPARLETQASPDLPSSQ